MIQLSIIIPAYNAENYIGKLIENILELRNIDYEVIIINDGSKDFTEKICLDFEVNNKQIKYFKQENQGVSAARNNGLSKASGKYIIFCDSDDSINALELEKAIIDCSNLDVDYYLLGYIEKSVENNSEHIIEPVGIGDYDLFNSEVIFFGNINRNTISYPFNKIFLNSVIKENNIHFNEEINFGEDLIFNLEYLHYSKKFYIGNYKYYIYNKGINEDSLSSKFKINFWIGRWESYKVLEQLSNCFFNKDNYILLSNEYVSKFILYTTRQIVRQNLNKTEKIEQLNLVKKQAKNKYKFLGTNLSIKHKFLLVIFYNSNVNFTYNLWRLLDSIGFIASKNLKRNN